MDIISALFGLFSHQPWLALLPAALLALTAFFSRSRFAWFVAALWLVYAAYEYGVSIRVLCSGECNIRVDLLLFAPLLVIFTLIACVTAVGKIRAKRF